MAGTKNPILVCPIIVFSTMLACTLCDGATQANASPSSPETIEARLPEFSVGQVTRLGALIEFGRKFHIPLGIEYVNRDMVKGLVTVSLFHPTVRQTIEAIMEHKGNYELELSGGVLDIRCATLRKGEVNLFSTVVPDFSIPRVDLATASVQLNMALTLRLRPGGFAGDYSPSLPDHVVGPLSLRGATVRQILNTIVRRYGDAAWVATVSPGNLDKLPPSGLWMILDYRDPNTVYDEQVIRQRLDN